MELNIFKIDVLCQESKMFCMKYEDNFKEKHFLSFHLLELGGQTVV